MTSKRKSSGRRTENEAKEYEKLREQRIKQNMERMQKLGILELSLKLKPRKPLSPFTKKTINNPLNVSDPPRRSSRLKTMAPVSYAENGHKSKKVSLESDDEICLKEGSKPEIYTEEHEKLLGDCKMSWTLCVDGYGPDRKRIYDPDNGETCHQCRQKTLGLHTRCAKCDLVQGQFCGDCLYMRYGENVIEVKQNPNWICPVCRGICNCSLCRKENGWAPTGAIYRKVKKLGYKSVAHYLIQAMRARADHKSLDSTKRMLPSADADEGLEQSPGPQAVEYEDELDKERDELPFSDGVHGEHAREDDDMSLTLLKTEERQENKDSMVERNLTDSNATWFEQKVPRAVF